LKWRVVDAAVRPRKLGSSAEGSTSTSKPPVALFFLSSVPRVSAARGPATRARACDSQCDACGRSTAVALAAASALRQLLRRRQQQVHRSLTRRRRDLHALHFGLDLLRCPSRCRCRCPGRNCGAPRAARRLSVSDSTSSSDVCGLRTRGSRCSAWRRECGCRVPLPSASLPEHAMVLVHPR